MNPLKLQLTLLAIFIFNLIFAQTTLIDYGSSWEYYDSGNEPSLQGSLAWYENDYDVSSWTSGNAQLGYGDGDEVTITNSVLTCYFRHSFNIVDATLLDDLNFNLIHDDGAIVYLNGTEIWRVNMPGGAITYNTFASSGSQDNELTSAVFANTLVDGINVISVEIHQSSSTSSDLSFDFELAANPPGGVIVSRGPYLQKASPSSMVIRWRTNTNSESVVRFGTTLNNLDQVVDDLNPKTEHVIELTGLNSNTIYYYQIENSSNVLIPTDNDLYFKTSPDVGSQQTVRAWILGDCGTATGNARAVRDAYYNYIDTDHTDMILFLGDNAYSDGTDSEYQLSLFENMYENKLKNTVAWSCLGNHDGYSANSTLQTGPYYDIFTFPTSGESGGIASGTEAYYSFDYGNIHFISLDSYDSDNSVGGSMYTWCESDIQNTTAEWIVAFWHHPPYSKGSHDSDTESSLSSMRENFVPMLEDNGVDLILSGHSHSYERSYFLNGHYGEATTFNSSTHTVGPIGDGDGRLNGNGPYEKITTGEDAGKGAVYVVTGSAGKKSDAPLDHNAMYYSVAELGSCLLEVNGNQMDVRFLRDTNTVTFEDYFTIIKDGTPCEPDTDADGICDTYDQCPGIDDNIIGTTCDDGDPCTTNDIYDNSCSCAGTYTDADGDGFCVSNDPDDNDGCNPDPNAPSCNPCTVLSSDDFEGGFGNWVDGGNDCSRVSSNANSGSYSIRLRDDSGVNSSMFSNNMDLSIYDEVTVDFSFYPVGMDNNEDFFFEISTDGGNQYDIVYQQWSAGIDFQNETRYDETILISGISLSINTRFRFRCHASGNNDQIFIDDIVINGCAANCNSGDPCDDGDDCTAGDIFDVNCNCSGTFQDSDNDGICDAVDQCPEEDDNIIGTSCDDGDGCTVNDVYDNSCSCAGTYTDADGDGLCISDDPDDNDGCNPDPDSPACNPCNVQTSEDFEAGFGNWNDGGNDCSRVATNANSGSYSIRLRDDSAINSSIYSDNLDLSTFNEAQIDFYYFAASMENGEDFLLEYSLDGGNNYTQYEDWIAGTDFENNSGYFESILVSNITFTATTRFRFRCDASGNNDQIYIDDIIISGCGLNPNSIVILDNGLDIPADNLNVLNVDQNNKIVKSSDIKIFPNPTKGILHVDTGLLNLSGDLSIYNMHGKLIYQHNFDEEKIGTLELNLSQFQDGIYMLHMNTSAKQFTVKKFVILKY